MELDAKNAVLGYLRQNTGAERGSIHSLTREEVLIGRNRNADIKIFSPSISRSHCFLRFKNDIWSIIDNKSFNGLYINFKKLKPDVPFPLRHGQKIYLGPPDNPDGETHSFTFYTCLENRNKNILPLLEHKNRNTSKNEKTLPEAHKSQSCIETLTPKRGDTEEIIFSPNLSKKRKPEENLPHSSEKFLSDKNLQKRQKLIGTENQMPESKITSEIASHSNITMPQFKTPEKVNMQIPLSKNILEIMSTSSMCTPSLSSPSLKERLVLIKQRLAESDKIQEKVQQTLRDSEAFLSQSHKQNLSYHPDFNVKEEEEESPESRDSQSLLTEVDKYYLDNEPYPFSQPLIDDMRYPSQDSTSSLPAKSRLKVGISKCEHETKKDKEKAPSKYVQENNQNEALRQELEKALLEKKELLEKHDLVKKEEEKLRKELESAKTYQQSVKSEVITQFGNIMEVEFTCGICTELFIKAVTLDCSHTFCEKCIAEWKKKKKQCPICRARINGETRALVIDNFINKMVAKLSTDYQERRETVVEDRLKETDKPKPPPQRKTKARRGRSQGPAAVATTSRQEPINLAADDSSSLDDDEIQILNHAAEVMGYVADLDYDDITPVPSSPESESSLEGYDGAYYGGYGRCFNCGRRGHWASGCPDP